MDNSILRKYIINAVNGDEESINILCSECVFYVSKYRNTIIGIYDYEDIRQIILFRILKLIKTNKIMKIDNFQGYIYAILRNTVNELIKTNKKHNRNLSIDAYIKSEIYTTNQHDFEEEYIRKQEIKEIIIHASSALKKAEKDIIHKYYFSNIPIAEYARNNHINYYTCIKRIRRAENKILRYMLQYYGINNKAKKFNIMDYAIGK